MLKAGDDENEWRYEEGRRWMKGEDDGDEVEESKKREAGKTGDEEADSEGGR